MTVSKTAYSHNNKTTTTWTPLLTNSSDSTPTSEKETQIRTKAIAEVQLEVVLKLLIMINTIIMGILRMMRFRIITTNKLMINNKMMMLFMESMMQMILIHNVTLIITSIKAIMPTPKLLVTQWFHNKRPFNSHAQPGMKD